MWLLKIIIIMKTLIKSTLDWIKTYLIIFKRLGGIFNFEPTKCSKTWIEKPKSNWNNIKERITNFLILDWF